MPAPPGTGFPDVISGALPGEFSLNFNLDISASQQQPREQVQTQTGSNDEDPRQNTSQQAGTQTDEGPRRRTRPRLQARQQALANAARQSGWQFNRLLVCPSFVPRIGPSFVLECPIEKVILHKLLKEL